MPLKRPPDSLGRPLNPGRDKVEVKTGCGAAWLARLSGGLVRRARLKIVETACLCGFRRDSRPLEGSKTSTERPRGENDHRYDVARLPRGVAQLGSASGWGPEGRG